MTIWEQAQTLREWLPLFLYASKISKSTSDTERNEHIAGAARWLSAQTKTTLDDELVDLCRQVIGTPEGNALVNWIVRKLETS
jgi:hypothetical protein